MADMKTTETTPFRYSGRCFTEAEINPILWLTDDPLQSTRADIARAVRAALNLNFAMLRATGGWLVHEPVVMPGDGSVGGHGTAVSDDGLGCEDAEPVEHASGSGVSMMDPENWTAETGVRKQSRRV